MTIFFGTTYSVYDWLQIFWEVGERIRYRIINTIRPWFSLIEFELFPGLVFGDDSLLANSTKLTLKTLGIYHALSASGSNVAVIQQLARSLAVHRSRQSMAVVQFACILTYLSCVGQAAPILRAVLARWYLDGGKLLHLQTHPLLAWLFAATSMVVCRPQFLTELSFQLSVLAALGMCLFLPKESTDNLSQLGMLAAQFREAFWQTAAAQLLVVPLLVLILGDSPTSALLVNTIAAPILSIHTLTAFLLAGFGALYGLLQAYDSTFSFFLQILLYPLAVLISQAYGLTNQSFNWVLVQVHHYAQLINAVLPVWVMMGCLGIVFAVRLGRLQQRMKYPPSLFLHWSHIAHVY